VVMGYSMRSAPPTRVPGQGTTHDCFCTSVAINKQLAKGCLCILVLSTIFLSFLVLVLAFSFSTSEF